MHSYGDCSTSNDEFVYFETNRLQIGDEDFYNLLDCGESGGYSNCSSMNDNQPAFGNTFGVIDAETDYGRALCAVSIMGSSSDRQNVGNSSFGIEGKQGSGSRGQKSWSDSRAKCQPYEGNTGDNTAIAAA